MHSDSLMGRGKGKGGSKVGKPGKGKSNVSKSGKVNILAEKQLVRQAPAASQLRKSLQVRYPPKTLK